MAGLVFGAIGLYLLRIGRLFANIPHIFLGLALMVYPYLVSGPLLTWGIGIVLVYIAYLKR